jgi:hypothetical protein
MIKGFFNQVVEHNHIKLQDPKRPDQVGMSNNPLYCPNHHYVRHVIEDCVAFKDWLQRAIDEKRLALQPDAINPDYYAVNMVSIGPCPESSVEEGKWVPLMQLKKELTNIHFHEALQRPMLSSGIQLGITSHHEKTFNVVKQVKLHYIPRSLCHGSMTQVVTAYPDDPCLCLKGMHNSLDMAKFFQHLHNSYLKTGGNLLNPQL